ncbi:RnfH family protein [Pseudaquabacterium pictum]|uniref:UPF0125 protein AQPW35_27580 n=1 Tax=Pseudaquabacterium pictum TaxID=2315236 RepID=A0A480AU08_9BURK|nr:RnfH family protein [Rubrivivax pictus]GCL63677.1 UPF0125 protein [Rubrivivax pictus]
MASAEPAGGLITIELAWSAAPQQLERLQLQLPAGSTALAALRASGLAERLGAEVLNSLTLALWGRAIDPATVLQPQDRLEMLRPLLVDPKEARRLRYRRDGIRPRRKTPRR